MKPLEQGLLLACAAATVSAAVVAGDAPPADVRATLSDLSRRLQAGDRTAIDDVLARTQPASAEPADAGARLDALRAEVERLRGVRVVPLVPARRVEPDLDAEPAHASLDPLREARAWLYADEPARTLKLLADRDGEAAYWRGRALEKLGRDAEALEAYRRAAAATEPAPPAAASWRAWAADDAAHLEWKARVAPGKVKP